MSLSDKNNQHVIVLTAVTIIVSFISTSGHWDVFDFIISGGILLSSLIYVNNSPGLEAGSKKTLVLFVFIVLTSTFYVAAFSVFSIAFKLKGLMLVSADNYKLLNIKQTSYLYQQEFVAQLIIVTISTIVWFSYMPLKCAILWLISKLNKLLKKGRNTLGALILREV